MANSFLTNTEGATIKSLDGHIFRLAETVRLAERKREQRVAKVFQTCGGGLRRQIVWGVCSLCAVGSAAPRPRVGLPASLSKTFLSDAPMAV